MTAPLGTPEAYRPAHSDGGAKAPIRMQKLDDIGSIEAPVGSRDWCLAFKFQVHHHINDAKTRVSDLKFSLKSIRDHAYYRSLTDKDGRPFETWEDFCQYERPWGLNFSAEVAEAIIAEQDGNKLVRVVAIEVMESAQPLAKHGVNQHSGGRVGNTSTRGSTNAPYLAARIKRDRPDIAEAVERGEYPSMRQAAIAAGIVKQKTPLEAALAAWAKLKPDERAEFMSRCGLAFVGGRP